jgi:hypothetical protein
VPDATATQKTFVLLALPRGMPLAGKSACGLWPRDAALVGVPVMLLGLGALSSAFDALQSLTAKKSSSSQATAGFSQTAATPFDTASPAAGSGGCPPGGGLSPATMSALLAAQGQSSGAPTPMSRSDALKDLFSQLDGNGDGQVSKSEFGMRWAPAAVTSRRPTTSSTNWTRTATVRSTSTKCRRR